ERLQMPHILRARSMQERLPSLLELPHAPMAIGVAEAAGEDGPVGSPTHAFVTPNRPGNPFVSRFCVERGLHRPKAIIHFNQTIVVMPSAVVTVLRRLDHVEVEPRSFVEPLG